MSPTGLWRDIHDRHWLLIACGFAAHFYAGHSRRHFYFNRYPRWEHPNRFGYPEFRRLFPRAGDTE